MATPRSRSGTRLWSTESAQKMFPRKHFLACGTRCLAPTSKGSDQEGPSARAILLAEELLFLHPTPHGDVHFRAFIVRKDLDHRPCGRIRSRLRQLDHGNGTELAEAVEDDALAHPAFPDAIAR